MAGLKPGSGIEVPKAVLDTVVRKLGGDNHAVKAFHQSLEVGQIITQDLLIVIGAVNGLLHSGLTKRALCVLVQDAGGKGPGGRPKYSIEDVEGFLDVLASLDQFLAPTGKAKAP